MNTDAATEARYDRLVAEYEDCQKRFLKLVRERKFDPELRDRIFDLADDIRDMLIENPALLNGRRDD